MPAHCSTSSTYDWYCQFCIDMHRTPPTREWWDNAVNQPRTRADRALTDDEFDDETERREGWAR
jgi:hypothetical protein